MNKKLEVTINIFGWIVLVLLIIFLINNGILPAYNSYLGVCNQERAEEKNITALGITSYDYETDEITVKIRNNLPEDLRKETIKHELVHVHQYKRGFLPTCSQPFGVIVSESEAYIMEDLYDGLFEDVYRLDLDDYY